MGDYYETLGLDRNATSKEIRDAYFDLVRTAHPDVNPDPSAKEKFLEIQEAYEVLHDPKKRRNYDSFLPDNEHNDPKIKINVKYSRSILPLINEPQLFYALLDFDCVADRTEIKKAQTHYCFVIDRSTSMQGERMNMVKANFRKILPKMNPSDIVSIVTFSDKPELLCASAPLGQIDSIQEKIDKIECSGSTEIFKGLKAGTDLLFVGGIVNPIRHLILLTDGHTYGDEEACFELSRHAFDHGIMISAMGIGNEWNDMFLDRLTANTGGSTAFVTSEEDLYNYLERQINSSGMVYAGKMYYEFHSGVEVSLKTAFRLQPDVMPLQGTNSIPMGDLTIGSKSQFLLEFLVQPLKEGKETVHLASGRVKMEMYQETSQKASVKLNLSVKTSSRTEKENPPIEIVKALSQLTLYHMQERNRLDVGNGEYQSAVKRMHYLASKMLSRGERTMAHQVLVEAERINTEHRFSLEGEKRIKYGTRGLYFLPEPKTRIS